jgi:hypothetical protein
MPETSIIETHIGSMATRDELHAIITDAMYNDVAPKLVVDAILDRLYEGAKKRSSGWAQLFIKGVKDGRY